MTSKKIKPEKEIEDFIGATYDFESEDEMLAVSSAEGNNWNDLIEENKDLKADISKYMNALENSSTNIEKIANANKHFAAENKKLLQKYIFKFPFPQCTETDYGTCGNDYKMVGVRHFTQTNACKDCPNRKWSVE